MPVSAQVDAKLRRVVPLALLKFPSSRAADTNPAGSRSDKIRLLDLIGTVVPFAAGSQIYGEGEPADYLYRVAAGIARGYRMTADGRRHIVAFYVPGDIFGFEVDDLHSFSADAVSNTKLRMIKRATIMAAAARENNVAEALRCGLARELRRNQRQVMLLGKTASERVASFVLEIAERFSHDRAVKLPMPRRDIADYLGITIETISRTLTLLTNMGAIGMSGPRNITVLDYDLLRQFSVKGDREDR